MKLTRLNIQSYKHLQDIILECVYPEGHSKAGLPLEKICIIGQSASGKTNILEIIKDSIVELNSAEILDGIELFMPLNLRFNGDINFIYKNSPLKIEKNKVTKNNHEFKTFDNRGGSVQYMTDDLKLLYFSSEIISKETIGIFNQNPVDLINSLLSENGTSLHKKSFIYEFLQDSNVEMWSILLRKILDYRKSFTQMASELINKGAIGNISKLNQEYEKWSKSNENPLDSFAKHFNPILSKLNLEVDLVNTEYSIPIKSKHNDEVIPISSLSTGTKGLLLSIFPLFELDTEESIILLDEPERSLFPDMQIDLIENYRKIAPSAQFIVATHSPFIAASFEPEERFILYFDEKGKVRVKNGTSPIGDDPNDILRNDFNVDYYNEFGKEAYRKYLVLRQKLSQENDKKEKDKLIVELAEIGDKYNF